MTIISLVSAGSMGAAIGARLVKHGCTVLTNLDGRSEATQKRAKEAGMEDVPVDELVANSDFVLSILPPRDAISFAKTISDRISQRKVSSPLIFADCNAVSPATSKQIASLFERSTCAYLDAGIIGGPPREDYDPTIYASADPADEAALRRFSELNKRGLKIVLLEGEGAGVGDASALKMSYAGISKGTIALWTTMILSAHASSPATATALLHELRASQPEVLKRILHHIPAMQPKAYRWIAEMEEISAFIRSGLDSDEDPFGGQGKIYEGIAGLFARITEAVEQDDKRGDLAVLNDFVNAGKKS